MRINLLSYDEKALDNAVKELHKCVSGKVITEVLRKNRANALRRAITASDVKLSVISQLELPIMVNITISH